MAKKKTSSKGGSNTTPTLGKPLFTEEEKLQVQNNPDSMTSRYNTPTTPPDVGDGNGAFKDGVPNNQYIQGMYWETGDVQVLVGDTHEFRLHQEILAVHSTCLSNQLQISRDSNGIVVAPRSEDIPVVVLRSITGEAFEDVLRLIYPSPGAMRQPPFTLHQLERLLGTACVLGMPGIVDYSMDILSATADYKPIQIYNLAHRFSLLRWQLEATKKLVYRTCSLTIDEAEILGAIMTAQIAQFRELFRARIFARFEPIVQAGEEPTDTRVHQGGSDSEIVAALGRTGGSSLGRCQQAILEGLKVVFDADGAGSQLARHIVKGDASIMENLEAWLQLGGFGGGMSVCRGCSASLRRIVWLYCRVGEIDAQLEQEFIFEG